MFICAIYSAFPLIYKIIVVYSFIENICIIAFIKIRDLRMFCQCTLAGQKSSFHPRMGQKMLNSAINSTMISSTVLTHNLANTQKRKSDAKVENPTVIRSCHSDFVDTQISTVQKHNCPASTYTASQKPLPASDVIKDVWLSSTRKPYMVAKDKVTVKFGFIDHSWILRCAKTARWRQ